MALMLAFAKPYSQFIAHSPKSLYTILVMAPSMLFCCMASSYRAYYEGFMNMLPTAVSQTIEALFKMIFGLVFAKYSMAYLYNMYQTTGSIFNQLVENDNQALSIIYPYTSAFAMLGVSLGSFCSFAFIFLYDKINKTTVVESKLDNKTALKELVSFSFPIMISCTVQSVFQFLDTASVQYSLASININALKNAYSDCLKISSVVDEDLPTYVYGLLSAGLDFKNLIPGITMALGVSAVPAVSSTYEKHDQKRLDEIINMVLKYTMVISLLMGTFFALNSEEILQLFYKNSSPDIVVGCSNLVKYYSYSVFIYCVAGTCVFCTQAIGLPQKSILPYAVAGVVRVALNLVLVRNSNFILVGTVISGAVGYTIITLWNMAIIKKYTHIKFNINGIVIKPFCIATATYFVLNKAFNLALIDNVFVDIILKMIICLLTFIILAFVFDRRMVKDAIYYIKCKKYGLTT
jgi:stage V sporulation protein B